MPGYEMWGAEERREVEEVLETGILMRYGFDGPRKGRWKARELEAALCQRTGAAHAQVVSSGTAALTTALAAANVASASVEESAPAKADATFLDGVNLLPLLEGKVGKLAPRELYFRFGVQHAVRSGDWKLVKAGKDMEPMLVNPD